jgi:hypothetical protein
VNHLGHFALTALLLPALLAAPAARVVSVTSNGRIIGRPLGHENPHLVDRYGPWRAYGQSKLAAVHFALELDRRFRRAGVAARSLVVHPGFTHTDLQARSARETGDLLGRLSYAAVRRVGMTPVGRCPCFVPRPTRTSTAGRSTRRGGSTQDLRSGARCSPAPGIQRRCAPYGKSPSARPGCGWTSQRPTTHRVDVAGDNSTYGLGPSTPGGRAALRLEPLNRRLPRNPPAVEEGTTARPPGRRWHRDAPARRPHHEYEPAA